MTDPQRWIDHQEITEAIIALFVATDEKDWDAALASFTPEIHFDMSGLGGPPPSTVAASAVVQGWKVALAPIEAIHHQIGNVRTTVRGDDADAACYGIAYHYHPNPSGQNTRTFVGTYDFHLVRRDRAWRIDRFRFTAKFVEGNLELEKM